MYIMCFTMPFFAERCITSDQYSKIMFLCVSLSLSKAPTKRLYNIYTALRQAQRDSSQLKLFKLSYMP